MPKANELELLERISNLLRTEARGAATRAGLQPVQLEVLEYLGRCNRYSDTPAGVAEFLGLTRGTVSQSILRLEDKGLIARAADPSDGRISHLELTVEGRKLAGGAWRRALEGAVGNTEDGESSLEGKLEAVLRSLQRANDHRSFGVCHSCRFFQREGPRSFRCGLTLERLSADDTRRVCREHEYAAPLEAD